ncbi:DUF6415 family natural product biosynthesis protein [Streptomyces sp. NBC_01433]|uniref:DUF6415 family natural product biosynthesis protein n=1 Tax=Streptomyces sp. NBC_01433 TaxID=2903864 RepID=UPI0022565EDE|nr:DUF6415 family natural product biosynthesis protein [Streptomyces sp. NBC_01433]MCX4677636.1 DUF6415 family natural product biosynthesis protein [Streptomyces sp. NBC_01433]
MAPAVPDEILADLDTVLAWDLTNPALPTMDVALNMLDELTSHGRIIARDLSALSLSLPSNSEAGITAQATLGEASRRLNISPPAGTPRATAGRAQNVARLFRALLRAVAAVRAEQAQIARR